jgi:diguanylate cyclase (GGDEF)-like protein/PAS domain S-box-containing protein
MSQPLFIPTRAPAVQTDQWFRTLAESTVAAIFVYREDEVLYVNPAIEVLTGYTVEEVVGRPAWHMVHPDFQPLMRERIAARLRGEAVPARYEFKILTKDGRERWIDATSSRLPGDADGSSGMALATAVDITERKEAERTLIETNTRLEQARQSAREGEERLRAMVEALAQEKELAQITLASIGDGVIRTDAAGIVDYLNPVAERLTGWSSAEACGRPVGQVFTVVDESTGKALTNPVERCLQEEDVIELPGYSLLTRRDGRDFAIRDSAAPIRDRLGRIAGCVLVFKDVTQIRGMEREMMYLARHDPLTGLINRREFEKRLQHCLATSRDDGRLHALFYLDLDEFKVVNDTCGHLAGDEMLKQVTALLKTRLRKTDTLARLGGDEFGVILEDTELDDARRVGDSLRTEVRSFRFAWQERIFEIGVSIGLVPITGESLDMAQVLSAADAACYVAKESGRNRMHEYQPDDSALAERYGEMQWIHRIHKAFAEHRFFLYRQSIEPLRPNGHEPPLCEIFIRMIDEEGRVASPGAFIPAAERYHLIASIDRWVIHAAFVSLACRILSHGDETCFAINLSGQSIGDEYFLEYVLEEMELTGVEPTRICFEITETAAVGNLTQAMRFIDILKKFGCRFVLDDFGSGLSSFAYLKNLSVDFLKIDGTFVRDMVGSPVQRALVESIHQIGQVMGIRTIAESVENRQTLDILREIGVDYVQGYGISLPEPLG